MAAAASTTPGELIYEAIGLKKQFDNGKVVALRGLDLEIRQGEFVAIVGQSGCGKSTLLQMLGSLDKPSEGTLTYRGHSIPAMPDPAAYRAHEIGFVFQAFHLLPTFTVLENVQIPMFGKTIPLAAQGAGRRVAGIRRPRAPVQSFSSRTLRW